MISRNADEVTQDALAVMAATPDPRLREIMTSLIKHLHGFVREVRLTETEFRTATALFNEIGQLTTDRHNEAVLMAGSLGVSSLVCLLNNGDNGSTETSQSLLGPFWRMNSPRVANGGSILRSDTRGEPMLFRGRVINPQSQPIAGAEIDIWHASPVGKYENEDPDQAEMNLRGKFTSDEDGRFWFRSVKPSGYPIPTHGVVGRLLAAQGRHPYRPAHVHALIFKDGYKTLTSQVYSSDDPYLTTDVQFGVTRALVAQFAQHAQPSPEWGQSAAPWYSLDYTFTMEQGVALLPRPPIK